MTMSALNSFSDRPLTETARSRLFHWIRALPNRNAAPSMPRARERPSMAGAVRERSVMGEPFARGRRLPSLLPTIYVGFGRGREELAPFRPAVQAAGIPSTAMNSPLADPGKEPAVIAGDNGRGGGHVFPKQ